MDVPKDLVERVLAYLGQQPCQQVYAMYTQLATLLYQAEKPQGPQMQMQIKTPDVKE